MWNSNELFRRNVGHKRRCRKLSPVVEAVEGRLLLSVLGPSNSTSGGVPSLVVSSTLRQLTVAEVIEEDLQTL